MNTARPWARLGVALVFPLSIALALGACMDEDDSSDPVVAVSGTLSYAGWTQGDYVAILYRDGEAIDGVDFLVRLELGTEAASTAYELPINGNRGDVYVFAFVDADASGGSTGATDAAACSAVFNLKEDDVGGVDLILLDDGTFPGCP